MKDNLDQIIAEYYADMPRSSDRDRAVGDLFVAILKYCPQALSDTNDLDIRSAIRVLRKCALLPQAEIARLCGANEVELSQWEAGVKPAKSTSFDLPAVLRCVLSNATRILDARPLMAAGRPSFAFARPSSEIADRVPLVAAINRAKMRAQFAGRFQALSAQKCHWYRHVAHQAERTLSLYLAAVDLNDVPLPVPVDLIAETTLGLEYYLDHMGTEVSGWFNPDSKRICINADEPRTRRRYTLAHEICHAFMHSDKLRGRVHRDPPAVIDEKRVEVTVSDLEALSANDLIAARAEEKELSQRANRETEANVFAAILAMPTRHLCKLIEDGMLDTMALARHFDVSVPAMEWRLRFLDACMGMPEAQPGSKDQGTLDLGP